MDFVTRFAFPNRIMQEGDFMNGYFKGVNTNVSDDQYDASRPKEPPTLRMQTEPFNAPRYALPEAPESVYVPTKPERPQTEITDSDYFGEEANFSNPGESQRESFDETQVDEITPPFSGVGGIVVQTFLAQRAIPLENVKVTVNSVEESPVNVSEVRYTDSSGRTEKIFLPAPDMYLSMQAQDTIQPYAIYKINAELDGYSVEPRMSKGGVTALVFDNICSIQNVEMIPVEEELPGSETVG